MSGVADEALLDRAPYTRALAPARLDAYPTHELVDQESFMLAGDILALARRAGVGPGVRVLDVCCGAAGPGRLVTDRLGCSYVGVDCDPTAVQLARRRTAGLPCRFEVGRVPPLPVGGFDVVLLLETLLAFADKAPVLQAVRQALVPGGRFALTVEEGLPLTAAERRRMPAADTVWPVPLATLRGQLRDAGLVVRAVHDRSRSHQRVAQSLVAAFTRHRERMAAVIGPRVVDDLLASHRLWSTWLATGRVRKLEVVASAAPADAPDVPPA